MTGYRAEKMARNIATGLVGQIVVMAITYASRLVFIRFLSAEYLGLNALFTNILSVLSLTELGLGGAITYNLYAPLASSDERVVASLMAFFTKAYRIVGAVILALGLAFLPFLDLVIKDRPNVPLINLYYTLFLTNSAIGYLVSGKRILVIADQREYLSNAYRYSFRIILNCVQMVLLAFTRNYTSYLVSQIVFTLLENLAISRRINTLYPYLMSTPSEPLETSLRAAVKKDVLAMLSHRFGGILIFGTDYIILSATVGIVPVGIYSNFVLIVNSLNVIARQFFSSMSASIGNLNVTESPERSHDTFRAVLFATFWGYNVTAISLFCLANDFIALWLGFQFTAGVFTVLLLAISYYLSGMRTAVLLFRDTLGLFWNDRFKPFVEVTINLGCGIILAQSMGIAGVLLATIISTLSTGFWIEPCILYRNRFKRPVGGYFRVYFLYGAVTTITGVACWFVCSQVQVVSLGTFFLKALICVAMPNAVVILFLRRKPEFSRVTSVVGALMVKYGIFRGPGPRRTCKAPRPNGN
jgi:O-antigen/teichoic acid export membrane protein